MAWKDKILDLKLKNTLNFSKKDVTKFSNLHVYV